MYRYQLIPHQFISFKNQLKYLSIHIYKPQFGKSYFENSSFADIYEWSFWIGWVEIRKRRKKMGVKYECEVCGIKLNSGEDWSCDDCNLIICWSCYCEHECEGEE